jgi:hypothetical protein
MTHGGMTNPNSISIPVAVLAERRPGVTAWAEWSWRAVEVLEEAPEGIAPWTVLRQEEGRTLFFAGTATIVLHPTDTTNYKHNIEARQPSVWVVLRPCEAEPGFALQAATVDAGEAHIYADVGNDLVEALPMPPGLLEVTRDFVARHHKERGFWKRRRDRDPEFIGPRGAPPPPSEEDEA